jgi:hypothetical protein
MRTKARGIILRSGLLSALSLLSVVLISQSCRERRESYYGSLSDAVGAGAIANGWVPDFLPESTHSIHEVHNPASPRTWCAFAFSPNDSQRFLRSVRAVDALPAPVSDIGDPGAAWWPSFMKGKLDVSSIRAQGFTLYIAEEPDVESKTRVVLFAIAWPRGEGFFYRTPAP